MGTGIHTNSFSFESFITIPVEIFVSPGTTDFVNPVGITSVTIVKELLFAVTEFPAISLAVAPTIIFWVVTPPLAAAIVGGVFSIFIIIVAVAFSTPPESNPLA